MSTLLNPRPTVAYDQAADKIIVTLRDGRDSSVVEFDPAAVPDLINALMAARCEAKQARKPVPLPPPMVRPATCPAPPASGPDTRPIRLLPRRLAR